MARLIATALADGHHSSIDFIWHGGETTMLPISFYRKALLVQSRFRHPGQRVVNGIQTNGTRLTPEWVRFFKENDFRVGVSLDGPPKVHDQYRLYASGRPSFTDVAEGMRLLVKNRVSFGVLMVIDQGAIDGGPETVFNFFVEYGIKSFGLLAAKPINDPDAGPGTKAVHYTNPQAMTTFLARMYDLWCEHGDGTIRIRELDGLIKHLRSEKSGFCTLAGHCFGNFFMIEPNGKVAHCELFLGDERYTVGSVLTDSFTSMRNSETILRLRAENETALNKMRQCPEFTICNGWCPHERYISVRHNLLHKPECCGLRDLIGHIRSRLHLAPQVGAETMAGATLQ